MILGTRDQSLQPQVAGQNFEPTLPFYLQKHAAKNSHLIVHSTILHVSCNNRAQGKTTTDKEAKLSLVRCTNSIERTSPDPCAICGVGKCWKSLDYRSNKIN